MNEHSSTRRHSTRREFLTQATAAAFVAPYIIPASAIGANGAVPPSERVTLGIIGTGGRGTDVMKAFLTLPDVQVVAVCDAYTDRRENAKAIVEDHYDDEKSTGTFKGCEVFPDFRDLVARPDIDAVSIATQDSWHVLHGLHAANAGKHLYIEKPLSLTIEESRALCKMVEKKKVKFQHGTQQRTEGPFRFGCELVRNKYIGDLKWIEVGSPYSEELPEQPEMPIPEGFDYEMWLGPAPYKPYTEKRCITPWWWYMSDYSIGFVAGWGIHHIDIAQWGNDSDTTGPVDIQGCGVFPKGGMCDTATAWYLRMMYDNGVELLFSDQRKAKHGVLFVGTEGWVHVDRSNITAEPKSLLDVKIKPDEINLYKSAHHQHNLIEAIKEDKETVCPVETAHRSMTICHLSQICMLLGRNLKWDPAKEEFPGDDEANALRSKPMRSPWTLDI